MERTSIERGRSERPRSCNRARWFGRLARLSLGGRQEERSAGLGIGRPGYWNLC
jgi:hypothetical protein